MPVINPLAIADYAAHAVRGSGGDVTDVQRNGVERLIFTYSYAWDSRDPAATAALFVDDAVVDFFLDGAAEPTHRTVGRERLLDGMIGRNEMLNRWQIETRHLMLNTVFGPVEDEAVQAVSTAMIYWQQLPGHPAPLAVQTGYYKSWCIETDLAGVMHPREIYPRPRDQ